MAVSSSMLPLGTPAPEFALPDPFGRVVTLRSLDGAPALVVMFICNHCPYVKHIRPLLADLTDEWIDGDVAVVGINSNDAEAYPDDSPRAMAQEIRAHGYRFPYLVDESQAVAKAFRAACTPDMFVFDGDRRLVYRGQFDASRPSNGLPVTGSDLQAAVDAVLAREPVPRDQTPSMGCSIKWRPGNQP